MRNVDEEPTLVYFRRKPDEFGTRPPLPSSLQNLETCFLLIALGRYPHALVSCASAVESSIKAMLRLEPEERRDHASLVRDAFHRYPALRPFGEERVREFRGKRDRVVHYGFNPPDDKECARLLLSTGLRFLDACYTEFFSFPLSEGMCQEFGEQLGIVFEVFDKIRALEQEDAPKVPEHAYQRCLGALGQLVTWHVKQNLLMDWEWNHLEQASGDARSFDFIRKQKSELEKHLDPSRPFDCPICHGLNTFICRIDFGPDDELATVRLGAAVCVECGLHVHQDMPFLTDRLCQSQLEELGERILREYGLGPRPSDTG